MAVKIRCLEFFYPKALKNDSNQYMSFLKPINNELHLNIGNRSRQDGLDI